MSHRIEASARIGKGLRKVNINLEAASLAERL